MLFFLIFHSDEMDLIFLHGIRVVSFNLSVYMCVLYSTHTQTPKIRSERKKEYVNIRKLVVPK